MLLIPKAMLKKLTAVTVFILISFGIHAQCSGTPGGGITIASISSACANDTIQLTVNNSTEATGLIYQWQLSKDSTVWQDIDGATGTAISLTQDSSRFYRRMITCNGLSAFSEPVKVSNKPLLQCYCKPTSNCTQNDRINKVELGTLSNTSSCSAAGYIDYSNSVAAPSVNMAAVVPVSVTVSPGGTEYVALWIDYNQDGIFDTNEFTPVGVGNGVTISTSINIPENIPTGPAKMRVRVRYNLAFNSSEACTSSQYGETEDYLINILPAPYCSGIPDGGITMAGETYVCPVDSVHLNVYNATSGYTGLTYQWQMSGDSIVWQDIPGKTQASMVTTEDSTRFYRRAINCLSFQAFSVPVKVEIKSSNLCYCRPANTQCNTTATITAVRLSGLHNSSNCSPLGYGDYTAMPAAPIQPGATIPVSVSATSLNSSFTSSYAVWIDYNQDGIFQNNEFTSLGSLQGTGTVNGMITIPADAVIGKTGMRIRSLHNAVLTAVDACSNFSISETEDYLVLVGNSCIVNSWTGTGGDNNWENAANWSCMQVPGENTVAVINNGTVVINSNPVIYSLILNPQANLSITPSFNLTVTH